MWAEAAAPVICKHLIDALAQHGDTEALGRFGATVPEAAFAG